MAIAGGSRGAWGRKEYRGKRYQEEQRGSQRTSERRTQGQSGWRMTKKGSGVLGPLWAGHPPGLVSRAYLLCPVPLYPQMLLHLFSDANYNLLGFNASFRFSLCPGGCQNHGQCQPPGMCVCEPGWGGPDCSLQECSAYCGSHGTCASVSCPQSCPPGVLIMKPLPTLRWDLSPV